MKKFFFLGAIFILILVTITGCDSGETIPREVEVYGRIIEYWDGSPVREAEVEIEGENEYTDSEGNFRFDQLFSRKTVDVKVTADNYWSEISRTELTGSEEFIEIEIKSKDRFSGSVEGNINLKSAETSDNMVLDRAERKSNDLIKSTAETPAQSAGKDMDDIPGYANNEVLLRFKDTVNIASLKQEDKLKGEISSLAGDESHLPRDTRGEIKIVRDRERSAYELLQYYKTLPEVEAVSLNRVGVHTGRASSAGEENFYSMDYREPNDEKFEQQWYHWDIYSPEAWTLTTGSNDITVAVIDTGYISHTDLDANIDEDEAYYYIDDDSGPGAKDEDALYNERTSHGTHIAGLIGAVGDNFTGIAGVNWDINIMPIRIFSDGTFKEDDLINAVYHAANNDADVINLSLAFSSDSEESDDDYPILSEALEYARNQGVTIVAAAGNDEKNFSYYPANSSHTISTAASSYSPDDYYVYYSNRGEDVMAPGGNLNYEDGGIISTHGYYDNQHADRYIYMEGTSQAAALVSGAAALLHDQGIKDPGSIQQALEETSDATTGNINIYRALGEEYPYEELYDEMEVMAAIKSGSRYYIVSDIAQPNRDGDYYLERVKSGDEIKIIGWINLDDSDNITTGDYFGESNPINVSRWEHKSGINFTVEKVKQSEWTESQGVSREILFKSPYR